MMQTGVMSCSVTCSPSAGYLTRSLMVSTNTCKKSLKAAPPCVHPSGLKAFGV